MDDSIRHDPSQFNTDRIDKAAKTVLQKYPDKRLANHFGWRPLGGPPLFYISLKSSSTVHSETLLGYVFEANQIELLLSVRDCFQVML